MKFKFSLLHKQSWLIIYYVDLNNAVIYPKLIPLLGERVFLTEGFQFFIRLLENLIKERKESKQVIPIFISAFLAILKKEKDIEVKSISFVCRW